MFYAIKLRFSYSIWDLHDLDLLLRNFFFIHKLFLKHHEHDHIREIVLFVCFSNVWGFTVWHW